MNAGAVAGELVAPIAAVGMVAALVAVRPRPAREPPTRHGRPSPVRRPHHRGPLARRREQRAADQAYPDAIELIVLAVRAGHLPLTGIAAAIPHLPWALQPAFAAVVTRTTEGERFADALAALPSLLGPMAAPLADSFAAADRYGLPLAPVLERLAEEARQHRRRQVDTLARQLPVRMAIPLVLCTLPSFVLLAIVPLLLAALSSLHQ